MKPILIATTNRGKIVELCDLLPGFQLLTPAEISLDMDVEETGSTYAENAALKASAFCRASGLIALADDSGLEVDALNGAPGLYSARFSPKPGATDADRRALLIERLAGFPRPWLAHFHCTVAIAIPGPDNPLIHFASGDCPGEIIPIERGSNGFGYDPIFQLSELGHTMAELTRDEKNKLSHRALAVTAAIPLLERLLR